MAAVAKGAVYTFARAGSPARSETAKLTAGDGAIGDELGFSVAIDDEKIVAGAHLDTVVERQAGLGLYVRAAGRMVRNETAKLTTSDGEALGGFGSAVAIDGDTIVAGAPGHTFGDAREQGSVYTFARTGAAARTGTARLMATTS